MTKEAAAMQSRGAFFVRALATSNSARLRAISPFGNCLVSARHVRGPPCTSCHCILLATKRALVTLAASADRLPHAAQERPKAAPAPAAVERQPGRESTIAAPSGFDVRSGEQGRVERLVRPQEAPVAAPKASEPGDVTLEVEAQDAKRPELYHARFLLPSYALDTANVRAPGQHR